jgi:2-hydroxychromene-2-carboxylate isomerase
MTTDATVTVDFFFDLSSPWTCLAFSNIQPILAETGAEVRWRPFLVGGVFNAVNPRIYELRAAPEQKALKRSFGWLREWAALAGVPMNFPSEHHPVKSVAAMRCCCALEQDQDALFRFARAAFAAYFTDARNIDDPGVLGAIANEAGLDGEALIGASTTPAVKDRLRANTEEAITRGAYGSPTLFVGGRMYFGNDQLPLVRQRIMSLAKSA